MIQSMTGFGKSEISLPTKKITIQLKSLNSKKFDIYSRIPSAYKEKEMQLQKLIAQNMRRGKIDFTLNVEETGGETSTKINPTVVKRYMEELKKIVPTASADDVSLLKIAVNLPDAHKTEKEDIDEEEFTAIKNGVEEALKKINQYRTDEGKALEKDFRLRNENLSKLLDQVEKIDPERIKNTRERLQNAVRELNEDVDENRFEQELVYYIEKYDITEEKTRLRNHIQYFTESLDEKESNGRKLGFICQEMGREINTIGSKSNFSEMQKLVVQMKDELEKIKEQILNVL